MAQWVKNQPVTQETEDVGSMPGSGRSLGGKNGNPLQYSRLEDSLDRGAWWATVHGVSKSTRHRTSQSAPAGVRGACNKGLLFLSRTKVKLISV